MTSPLEVGPAVPAPAVCVESDCERPSVVSSVHCRVHLAGAMRRDGAAIPFEGPELAGLVAAVTRITETTIEQIPPALLDPGPPKTGFDAYVLLHAGARFGPVQFALDLLATGLSDHFGWMRLSPPTAYMTDVMLHAQIAGPQAEEFTGAVRSALVTMVLEFLPDQPSWVAVVPALEPADVVAAMHVAFPHEMDLARFAEAFGTHDYFAWQMELGDIPGVGAVISEPCTALGADIPTAGLLPPNLMISFAIEGDPGQVIRLVVHDIERRLAGATAPIEIRIGVSITLRDTTPESFDRALALWEARGFAIDQIDEEARVSPMAITELWGQRCVKPRRYSPAVDAPVDRAALTQEFRALLADPDDDPPT